MRLSQIEKQARHALARAARESRLKVVYYRALPTSFDVDTGIRSSPLARGVSMPALFSVSGQINFSAGVGVGSALFNRPEKTNVGEKRYYVVIEASRFVDEGEPYEPKENDRVDIPLSSNPNALEAFRVVEAAPLRFGVRAIAWRLLVTR